MKQNKSLALLSVLGLGAVATLGAVTATAQTANKSTAKPAAKTAPATKSGAARKPGAPGQRGPRGSVGMFEKLNLTAAQKAKIEPIMKSSMTQMKALHENKTLTQEQKRARMRSLQDSTQAKIRPILTATQQKQLDEMKKARENRQGKRPGGPRPGGR